MAHAQFALGEYPLAASHLQEALMHFPELPLVALRPKAFFGSEDTYAQKLAGLEKYLAGRPSDAGARLLMAYLLWCEETRDARKVLELLSEARQAAKEPGIIEAVDIFTRGVSAAGGPQQPPDAETGQALHPDSK